MPLDSTPGGASADSYCSVADADAYFGARLNTAAWDAADVATKEKALKAATARLEQEAYAGWRSGPPQRLAWPRHGIAIDGIMVDSFTIPAPVVNATCEMALALLNGGSTDFYAPTGLEGFARVAVGDLDITPRQDGPAPGALPVAVARWLRGLRALGDGTTKLYRG